MPLSFVDGVEGDIHREQQGHYRGPRRLRVACATSPARLVGLGQTTQEISFPMRASSRELGIPLAEDKQLCDKGNLASYE